MGPSKGDESSVDGRQRTISIRQYPQSATDWPQESPLLTQERLLQYLLHICYTFTQKGYSTIQKGGPVEDCLVFLPVFLPDEKGGWNPWFEKIKDRLCNVKEEEQRQAVRLLRRLVWISGMESSSNHNSSSFTPKENRAILRIALGLDGDSWKALNHLELDALCCSFRLLSRAPSVKVIESWTRNLGKALLISDDMVPNLPGLFRSILTQACKARSIKSTIGSRNRYRTK